MGLEAVLVYGVLSVLLGVLVVKAGRARTVLGCLAVVCAVSFGVALKRWTDRAKGAQSAHREFAAKIPQATHHGGYVSSDACQSCHSDQYESWHRSFHRTMTQEATPGTVLANFRNVTLQVDGEEFRLEQRGEEYWAEMVDPDWKHDQAKARAGMPGYKLADPKTAPRVWKRIGMITGSHHFQAFWVPSLFGNAQFAFPFAWLIPEQRWVPRKDTFIRDPALPSPIQSWNLNCIQCHTTAGVPAHDPKTKVIQSKVAELGIACESCHGPAETHVTQHQNPLHRYLAHFSSKPDTSIVQPRDLSPKAQTEVCGQCHGMKWTLDPEHWRLEGHSFRPGGTLETSAPLIRPANFEQQPWLPEALKRDTNFLAGAFWPDGMIRVTGREYNGLIESACHLKGGMSCLSCHSIHGGDRVNQLGKGMEGNRACIQCHESIGARLTEHTHHAAGSSGSECYNCHMPYATYGLLKSVRNHYIDSPRTQTTLEAGRPNACNLCHMDQPLAWSAQHLNSWYGTPLPKGLTSLDQTVSASVVMLLKGDAAQRALMAAGAGWAPARAVSGTNWMNFYLCQLLDDPYSAVRLIAYRSLQKSPEFQALNYDFVAPAAERTAARRQALERWTQLGIDRTGTNVLMAPNGRPEGNPIQRLLAERDRRRLDLIE